MELVQIVEIFIKAFIAISLSALSISYGLFKLKNKHGKAVFKETRIDNEFNKKLKTAERIKTERIKERFKVVTIYNNKEKESSI